MQLGCVHMVMVARLIHPPGVSFNVFGREEEDSSNKVKVQEESAAIAPFAAWLVRLHKLESLNLSGLLASLFAAVLF
jgi:hypothetical protein